MVAESPEPDFFAADPNHSQQHCGRGLYGGSLLEDHLFQQSGRGDHRDRVCGSSRPALLRGSSERMSVRPPVVLKHTTETLKPVVNRPISILHADGREIPISISTALLRDEAGRIIGGVETFRDLSLVESLRKEIDHSYRFQDIISRSPLMQRIFAILPDVAQSDSTVLIQGESGTGKELLSRAIHDLSSRAKAPLCGGQLRGTPRHAAGIRTLRACGRGPLQTPNEIAQAGSRWQREAPFSWMKSATSLPRFKSDCCECWKELRYEPLGSSKTIKADVRVLVASNRDLAQLVEAGVFRKDLYYRINVVRLELPPLARRKGGHTSPGPALR